MAVSVEAEAADSERILTVPALFTRTIRSFSTVPKNDVTSAIKEEQDTDVDAVSDATFSSSGIKEALADDLGVEYTNPNNTAQRGHNDKHNR